MARVESEDDEQKAIRLMCASSKTREMQSQVSIVILPALQGGEGGGCHDFAFYFIRFYLVLKSCENESGSKLVLTPSANPPSGGFYRSIAVCQ